MMRASPPPPLPSPSSSSSDGGPNTNTRSRSRSSPTTHNINNNIPSSVFDAIRTSDWEGLLTLYATTARDAVLSAEFARRGVVGGHDDDDEKKTMDYNNNASSSSSLSSSPSRPNILRHPSRASSSSVRELEAVVREIGAFANCDDDKEEDEDDEEGRLRAEYDNDDARSSKPLPPSLATAAATLSSPVVAIPIAPARSSDRVLAREADEGGEEADDDDDERDRIMWESAAGLSNARPSPAFVVTRRDRERRERRERTLRPHDENNKDDEDDDDDEEEEDEDEDELSPVFEGHVANATPVQAVHPRLLGQQQHQHPQQQQQQRLPAATHARLRPGGSGTAQHLACALDSPLALALLTRTGADPTSRHTAFRRLPAHEAACADSPDCLRLLLLLAKEEEEEGEGEEEDHRRVAHDERFAMSTTRSSGVGGGRSLPSQFDPRDRGAVPSRRGGRLNLFRKWNNTANGNNNNNNKGNDRDATARDAEAPPPPPLERAARRRCSSFPSALGTMWESVRMLRSGELDEMGAARRVLDRVVVVRSPSHDERTTGTTMTLSSSRRSIPRSAATTTTTGPLSHLASVPSIRHGHSTMSWDRRRSGEDRLRSPERRVARRQLPPRHRRRDVDGHGNTPLHWAAFKNSARAVRVLLSLRPDDNDDGVTDGSPDSIIIDDDDDDDDDDEDSARRRSLLANARAHPSGWTPLHDAAYSNAADAVSLLVAAGADVDAQSRSGATPLCFAAQEDAPDAARRLLEAGADPAARCLGADDAALATMAALVGGNNDGNNNIDNRPRGRFSGYTPLHYCAHYDAGRAARALLDHARGTRRGILKGGRDRSLSHPLPMMTMTTTTARGPPRGQRYAHGCDGAADLLEIPDLNDRLPIHVAVARGSSRVLRELLHGGARLETRRTIGTIGEALASSPRPPSPRATTAATVPSTIAGAVAAAVANDGDTDAPDAADASPPGGHFRAPVSSPVLRSMIPSQPVRSSKPWNCLSQKSIDACRRTIDEAEMCWTPTRHGLFAPADRAAVVEVLRVGKRLERMGVSEGLDGGEWGDGGRGVFLDLWPRVLGFCGRGWFEPDGDVSAERGGNMEGKTGNERGIDDGDEDISMQCSMTSSGTDDGMEGEFTQFQLDDATESMAESL